MTLAESAGKYRIEGRLAAGGMGEVYRASMETFEGFQKAVALKVVKATLARDPEFAQLFVEEAKVAMSLSHGNVVQAFDVGRIDDRWFLAMEYVEGLNLAALLRLCRDRLGQPLPHRHVLLIAVEALKGLDYAHRRRAHDGRSLDIVHRDVSPGNLLVSREGEVKVADFGIAKSTLRSVGSVAGTVKGKVPYMAPEQLRGGAVDCRADLYGLGAVLYEMLTGRRLVQDDRPTVAIPRVLAGDFPEPRQLQPSVPADLEHIVLRALARQPEDRYPNAAAMRQELEAFAMRSGYLLSTADLADFVTQLLEEGDEPARGGTRAMGTMGAPSGGVSRQGESPIDAAPAATAEEARPSAGDPFDALLGAELEKVGHGTEPFSVFTTRGGRRLETSPGRDTGATDTPAPAIDTTPPAASLGAMSSMAPAAPVEPTGPVPTRALPGRRSSVARLGVLVALLVILGGAGWLALTLEDRAAPPAAAEAPPEGAADVVPPAEEEQPTMAAVEPPPPTEATRPEDTADDTPEDLDPGTAAQAPPTRAARATRRRPRRAEPTSVPVTAREPAPVVIQAEPGFLSVNTDPWSYVYVDGNRVGATPQLRHALPPGSHRIRLHNPSENIERSLVIELREGEHRRISLDLQSP